MHEVDLTTSRPSSGILPLRDTLLFPQAILPLAVARESSVALVNDAVKERKVIGVVTQRDPAVDDPVGERPLPGRDPHPHPQDVPLPGRLAAPRRPGDPALPHPADHPVPPVHAGAGRAPPRGRARRPGDRGARARPERPRASSSGWWSSPPPSPTSSRPSPATSRSRRPPRRLHRRAASPRSTPRRSRSSWRRSTSAAGSSASTRCSSRTSRCSRSAARSRARSRASSRRTSASTTCASR